MDETSDILDEIKEINFNIASTKKKITRLTNQMSDHTFDERFTDDWKSEIRSDQSRLLALKREKNELIELNNITYYDLALYTDIDENDAGDIDEKIKKQKKEHIEDQLESIRNKLYSDKHFAGISKSQTDKNRYQSQIQMNEQKIITLTNELTALGSSFDSHYQLLERICDHLLIQ